MATIQVEVVLAMPGEEHVVMLSLPGGTTVADAIAASGLMERHRIAFATHRAGIYGKTVQNDALLADGDRVEIYRPLVIDPKDARRRRAASGKNKRSV